VASPLTLFVAEGIALVQRELFGQRVSLRTEFAPALPTVLADRGRAAA